MITKKSNQKITAQNFHQKSFRKGFLLAMVLIFAILISSCARRQLISSPEGTTTTHVQNKEVLVFAPRAARAQKVVFDTADKQMIHEPDTPFRKFFNAHSADFRTGMVDYAKTTILNDLVNRVKNMEYIRSMINEVIERHKEAAIQPIPNQKEQKKREAQVKQRNRNAKLLEDALYNALVDEGYPNLRDERIYEILDKFFTKPIPGTNKQYEKIWEETTDNSINGVNAFKLDLMQTLREKRFFRKVIDDAIAKRLNLFKFPGSATSGVDNALEVLNNFATHLNSLGYISDLSTSDISLWKAFILKNKSNFKVELEDPQLFDQGEKIRADLLNELNQTPDFKQALKNVLAQSKYQEFLSPDPNLSEARDATTTKWPEDIAKIQLVINEFASLKKNTNELVDEEKIFLSANTGMEQALELYKNHLATYVDIHTTTIQTIKDIEEALRLITNAKSYISYTPGNSNFSTTSLVDLAQAVNIKILAQQTAGVQGTTTWKNDHWKNILLAQREYNGSLDFVINDRANNKKLEELDLALITLQRSQNYEKDPTETGTTLRSIAANFKTPHGSLVSQVTTLEEQLAAFVSAVEGLKNQNYIIPDDIKNALKKINEVNHSPAFLKRDATTAAKLISDGIGHLDGISQESIKNILADFKDLKKKRGLLVERKAFFKAKQNAFMSAKDSFITIIERTIATYNANLPSSSQLKREDVDFIKDKVKSDLNQRLTAYSNGKNPLDTALALLTPSFNIINLVPDTKESRLQLANAFNKLGS